MPKLPNVKGKQLLKILERIGYDLDHTQGSHHILRRAEGKKTTIPIHGNKEIPKGRTKERVLSKKKKIKFLAYKKGCSWEIRMSWHILLDDIREHIQRD